MVEPRRTETMKASRLNPMPPPKRKRKSRRTDSRAYRTHDETEQAQHLPPINHDMFWEQAAAHQQERFDARLDAL